MAPVECGCKLNNYPVLTLAESPLKYPNAEYRPVPPKELFSLILF